MAEVPDRSVATNGEQQEKKEQERKQKPKKEQKPKQEPKQKPQQGGGKKKQDDAALIGVTNSKEHDISAWYQEVLMKGDFLEYSDIPGCYIINPSAYVIWEAVQNYLNPRIKKLGVKNCYFPIFISEANLQREKDHLEGFEAEVAWVTHGGKEKLASRLAIRPTSETAMYPYYAKKIRSHRDLPLRLNQWNNVVRWEFKHAMPFLRSREFLWQEGHTAHLTKQEADTEVLQILEYYAGIYEELLAVPVVRGTKTDNEKFAGSLYTTTIEGYIPATGRAIQAGTSHCLGQHFAKMFDITVQDPSAGPGEKKPPLHVWQNSWGFSTRSIGVMVLIHGDDQGLVIPPRVADIQVVIVPVGITAKTTPEDRDRLYKEIEGLQAVLEAAKVRVEIDFRDTYSPAWKFNDWELKGVPLRIEFGPKDAANHVVTYARRDQRGQKGTIEIPKIGTEVPAVLEAMQNDLYNRANDAYKAHKVRIEKWDEFVPALNAKNVCLIRHCLGGPCEDQIKDMSKRIAEADGVAEDERAPSMGAKSLCIPFEQPTPIEEGQFACTNPKCDNKAKKWVMFGRSY